MPEVYCHQCSVAGGAERPVYHLPPVCSPPSATMKEALDRLANARKSVQEGIRRHLERKGEG